jgi:hypothetical protein
MKIFLTAYFTVAKAKAKAVPLHAMEALEGERRYSSYSFSTSALAGGEWSASRPGHALAPGRGPPAPIVQEAGWAPEPVWTHRLEEKSFRLCWGSNLDRLVVQPVARHYTDWLLGSTSLVHTYIFITFHGSIIIIQYIHKYNLNT